MNNEIQSRSRAETVYLASLVIIELILLPALPLGRYGAIAMAAGAILGIAIYLAVFGARLRARGQTKQFVVTVALAFAVGVALSIWLVLKP
jgi:hypothetical protein